jgi:hypothetical protein
LQSLIAIDRDLPPKQKNIESHERPKALVSIKLMILDSHCSQYRFQRLDECNINFSENTFRSSSVSQLRSALSKYIVGGRSDICETKFTCHNRTEVDQYSIRVQIDYLRPGPKGARN